MRTDSKDVNDFDRGRILRAGSGLEDRARLILQGTLVRGIPVPMRSDDGVAPSQDIRARFMSLTWFGDCNVISDKASVVSMVSISKSR